MNQSLMVSGAYGNSGNLIQIFNFQPLFKTNEDFPIVQLVAHQFLALVVMVRVHLGKPNMYPQLSRKSIGLLIQGSQVQILLGTPILLYILSCNWLARRSPKPLVLVRVQEGMPNLLCLWRNGRRTSLRNWRETVWVQVPLGTPICWISSLWLEQLTCNQQVVGSIPTSSTKIWAISSEGERLFCTQKVVGSSPTLSTKLCVGSSNGRASG